MTNPLPNRPKNYHRVRATRADHEAQTLKIGGVAVYSILRDWVKGQVTAIEIGMLTFEAAFLSHILLPSGRTVIEHMHQQNLIPQKVDGG
ncbi:hypothetical protein [Stenotrophomonas sp. PS02289]|uniref:hypothetical protein n=1 Tax=Stenotrophomonas sp. PS02289 TaxID=2991422 RepID=UPI00249CEE02|nr:hypothetical protein [Stenotrophomonas sp. PS02289]